MRRHTISAAVAAAALAMSAPAVLAQTLYPPMPTSPGAPYAGSGGGMSAQPQQRAQGAWIDRDTGNGNGGNGNLIERTERAIRDTPHLAPNWRDTDYGPLGDTGRIGGIINGDEGPGDAVGVTPLTRAAWTVDVARANDLGGRDVYGAGGEHIGEVAGVLADSRTGQVSRIVIVDEGWFGAAGDHVAIPLQRAYLTSEGHVLLSWPEEVVEQMANVDPERLGGPMNWVELD